MKVGRATKEDINAATRLVSILDAVEEGYYPPSDKENDEETDTFFDYDDKKHLRHFYDLVMQQVRAQPAGINRVVWGFCAVIDSNITDPDCEYLKLHPDIEAALLQPNAQVHRSDRKAGTSGATLCWADVTCTERQPDSDLKGTGSHAL